MPNKDKQITFLAKPDVINKIDEIKEHMGFYRRSDALRYAVTFTTQKIIPDYKRIVEERNSISVEDKAARQVALKEEKERLTNDNEKAHIERLVKALDAVLLGDGTMASFKTYKYVNENITPFVGEQTVSVEELSQDDVDNQYRGAPKEVILEMINTNKD